MKEQINEILASIRQNKLRTVLTGFSVAWGILMLMILLGSGNGYQRGIMSNFRNQNINTIALYPGRTQMPYKGHPRNRRIRLKQEDANLLKKEFPFIIDHSAERGTWGRSISVNNTSLNGVVTGITPSHMRLEGIELIEGRTITQRDIDEMRKVVIINTFVNENLFGKNRSGVGKYIEIDNSQYRVIGITEPQYSSVTVYTPISTFSAIYRADAVGEADNIILEIATPKSVEQAQEWERKVKSRLAQIHQFSPDDYYAIYTYNSAEDFIEMNNVFTGIKLFLWIVGLTTLLIGVIGVSNIMIVTVKERTFEFGIRKSMGATPGSLVRLVLIESVVITSVFGYIGLLLGVIIMKITDWYIEYFQTTAEDPMIATTFKDPTVDMGSAIGAVVVLIIAGVVAGYIPARRAAKLKTIDAMRHNR